MRRAGQEHIAPVRTALAAPPAESSRASGSSKREREAAGPPGGTLQPPSTEILLSPGGVAISDSAACVDPSSDRGRRLAVAIRQRIESRLGGRIHDLAVRVSDNTIVLEGRCATYYSKQLAQHAALGVIEDEHLENAIVVAVR